MLRIASTCRVSATVAKRWVAAPVRNFSEKLEIPTDKDQQAGRRREEIDAEAVGQVGFNRDPIVPPADAGTRENPILVRIY